MDYLEIRFFNEPAMTDILAAVLADHGFDMFEEHDSGLCAYIQEKSFDERKFTEALRSIPDLENIPFEKSLIREQNWNATWESNFQPVTIAGRIHIRAPFHPQTNFETEIIIEPKMSFGTGHHSTTSMMVEYLLNVPVKNEKILDMGCGSGILAIIASKFGASDVLAIDNDDWAIENCRENCLRNAVPDIKVLKGEAGVLKNKSFSLVLANINRNVLLNDIPVYSEIIIPGGGLLISGFLAEDKSILCRKAEEHGFRLISEMNKLNWMAIHFRKNE